MVNHSYKNQNKQYTMSNDNFVWDNQSVCDFYWFMKEHTEEIPSDKLLNQFKESKQPKKEYEILQSINENTHHPHVHEYDEKCINNNCKIHSVKRLSDGAIFSIGDKLKDSNEYLTIDGFIEGGSPNNNKRFKNALWVSTDLKNNYGMELYLAKKVEDKVPIFICNDGKEAFDGDIVWHLCTMDGSWKVTETKARKEIKNVPSYFKYFSTEQLAKDYVRDNKPTFTVAQIDKICSDPNFSIHDFKNLSTLLNKL